MVGRQTREALLAQGEIVAAPIDLACADQSFGLPRGIYIAMASMFVGFVLVMSSAFRGHMVVSYGVILAFITAFFAVPSIFPRMAGKARKRAPSWFEFSNRGISTATGHVGARDATILILLLPLLVLCFGIAVATIAALV
jgi:hypothetical protein